MRSVRTSRRRCAIWLGFGLFSFGERLGVSAVDDFAASGMQIADPFGGASLVTDERLQGSVGEHWTAVRNSKWRWYERETLVADSWTLSGVTTPIALQTAQPLDRREGYLDERLVPVEVLIAEDRVRLGHRSSESPSQQTMAVTTLKPAVPDASSLTERPLLGVEAIPVTCGDRGEPDAGRSNETRRARHGRPPSRWLRSLTNDQIRSWLAKVEIQDAHVSGMSFWTHLTRDHSFAADQIQGLSDVELAELHGAAHAGF